MLICYALFARMPEKKTDWKHAYTQNELRSLLDWFDRSIKDDLRFSLFVKKAYAMANRKKINRDWDFMEKRWVFQHIFVNVTYIFIRIHSQKPEKVTPTIFKRSINIKARIWIGFRICGTRSPLSGANEEIKFYGCY